MKSKSTRTPKAYKNLEFLVGPDARSIRILTEFLEPASRFKAEGIKEAIVFFGSARFKPMSESKKILAEWKKRVKADTNQSKKIFKAMKEAEIDVEMSRYYEDALKLSTILTKWSLSLKNGHRFVICSGGGPGIMEAANKGALLSGGKSIGLNISLPHEQESNPYISPNLNFEFHYFFMRKLWFMSLAEALVMFPGGFGTMDEMMEVLTLIQTTKVKTKMPVVLYGPKYWNQVLNFDFMVKYHTISKQDLKLFKFADTPEEAFEILKKELTKHLKRKQ
ncbi:MAG: LOG family protein [Ignavibacteriae bacterium]|nr:LOG family protein [Ignavibacteriota bacterium]